jgi:hypothetical protein
MVLGNPGVFERRLTANNREVPSHKKSIVPPGRLRRKAKEIERLKGVKYLGRKPVKDPPWGYSR